MTFTQLQQVLRSLTGKPATPLKLDGGGDVLMVGSIPFRETPIGWVSLTPITRAQWRAYEPAPIEWKRTWVNAAWEDDLPATDITLTQIAEFIDNVNFGIPGTGLPGECRLPTLGEALTMALAVEDTSLPLDSYGTFSWQPWIQPVGFSAPNAWGLWDTVGCIWQWCDDGPEEQDVVQPTGTIYTYKRRFASGGSWKYRAQECLPEAFGGRGYFAIAAHHEIAGRDVGFRLIVPKENTDQLTLDVEQAGE